MQIAERYQLLQPITRGGMGQLWEGSDIRLNRRVVVKRIRRDRLSEDTVRRFRREARIMALLRHPGVATVYDFGEDAEGLFLVMEYVDGLSVAHVLDAHRPLPVSWAAAIGAQLCAVLAVTHAQQLIHRDLKPGNLMLCPDGSVVVLDFGLSTVLNSPDFSKITHSMDRLGTDRYMAPETVTDGVADALTDLYAVGCLLYEMTIGRRVFEAATIAVEVNGHLYDEPVSPADIDAAVPDALDHLILELLEKDPAKRPQTAEDVFHRLLPFARRLPPLPGVIDHAVAPTHLYAAALARTRGL
ncbi:serine/threonine protein kinase [Planotetraspora thailandica]|uniref:non-specific serine/threonine protein kinase n=1 Tax=Planotetraspora thailandica TaxID=487172 RepID=A0A8J3V4B4_9ACTN|nr:serine/threonine protein kinase [Planotetraspora thailandica]